MTSEERNSVLDEAIEIVKNTHVNHGDHYASYFAPSIDAERLAEAIQSLKISPSDK